MAFVALNIKGIPVSELLNRAKHIAKSLKENKGFFSDTPIPIWELEAMINELSELITSVTSKDSIALTKRNQQVGLVKEALRELANYVQIKSKGNSSIILKSGMFVKKTGSYTRKEIVTPHSPLFKFSKGNGQLTLHWKCDKNVMNYIEFSQKPEEETSWRRYAFSSKQKIVIEGLTSGNYYFRIMSVTAGVTTGFSEIATCHIEG